MPKIRRWFNVSHDINSDEEVWELTDRWDAWGLRVWLQILSIADRNEGFVKGDLDMNARAMARLSGSNSKRYNTEWRRKEARLILEWMLERRWIEWRSDIIFVRNYLTYRPSREAKRDLLGSPPNSPHSPDLTKLTKKEEEKSKKPQAAVLFILPDWIPKEAWEGYVEMRKKARKPLTQRAIEIQVKKLDEMRSSGQDPGAILDQSVASGWLGLFEVKIGGNQNGQTTNRSEPAGAAGLRRWAKLKGIDQR